VQGVVAFAPASVAALPAFVHPGLDVAAYPVADAVRRAVAFEHLAADAESRVVVGAVHLAVGAGLLFAVFANLVAGHPAADAAFRVVVFAPLELGAVAYPVADAAPPAAAVAYPAVGRFAVTAFEHLVADAVLHVVAGAVHLAAVRWHQELSGLPYLLLFDALRFHDYGQLH